VGMCVRGKINRHAAAEMPARSRQSEPRTCCLLQTKHCEAVQKVAGPAKRLCCPHLALLIDPVIFQKNTSRQIVKRDGQKRTSLWFAKVISSLLEKGYFMSFEMFSLCRVKRYNLIIVKRSIFKMKEYMENMINFVKSALVDSRLY